MASTYAFEKYNLSHCLYCGQILSVIKIPGGELPWDTDVDFPLYSRDYVQMKSKVLPELRKFGTSSKTDNKNYPMDKEGA